MKPPRDLETARRLATEEALAKDKPTAAEVEAARRRIARLARRLR